MPTEGNISIRIGYSAFLHCMAHLAKDSQDLLFAFPIPNTLRRSRRESIQHFTFEDFPDAMLLDMSVNQFSLQQPEDLQ